MMIIKCTRFLGQFSTKGQKIGVNTAKNTIKQKMPPPPLPKIPKVPIQEKQTQIFKKEPEEQILQTIKQDSEFQKLLEKKIPVITVMGHVDHGKTTLIDFLRKSNIAEKEDGGITQRIGAFSINYAEKKLTFIDTPGHEAFTNMRKRGASLTDLVILVVSATEGVKQQTKEVIKIIQSDNIPVIVAINKIDLPQANPQQVEEELEKEGLSLEVNGGNIPVVHISAKNGMNLDLLCELIAEETNQLKAISEGLGEASVLEAYQTKQGLNSMTVIVEKGCLKVGSLIVIGDDLYKIKSMQNDSGHNLQKANPGDAVQIKGIPKVPNPGDQLFEVENEKKAHFLIQKKKQQNLQECRETSLNKESLSAVKLKFKRRKEKRAFCRGVRELWMDKFNQQEDKIKEKIQELEQIYLQTENQSIQQLIQDQEKKLKEHEQYVFQYIKNTGQTSNLMNFTMKFGEKGMEETTLIQLEKLKPVLEKQTGIKLNLLKTDIGEVNVSDLEQAKIWNAKIFTFGAQISQQAMIHITDQSQSPKVHKLIHTLLKDIKESCLQKKIQSIKGIQRGRSSIMEIFNIKKNKGQQIMVPGIQVNKGKITKKGKCYVFRNNVPISQPLNLSFLKCFKKQVTELKKGEEGTVGFSENIGIQIKKGDQLVCYE